MVAIMRISEMYDKDVFTDAGKYFGKVSDVVLGKFMIHGWVIKSTPQSILKESLGNVRAVIVPHKAVKAIGDVVIISQHIELGKEDEEAELPEEEGEGASEAKDTPLPVQETPQPRSPSPFGGPSSGGQSPFRF